MFMHPSHPSIFLPKFEIVDESTPYTDFRVSHNDFLSIGVQNCKGKCRELGLLYNAQVANHLLNQKWNTLSDESKANGDRHHEMDWFMEYCRMIDMKEVVPKKLKRNINKNELIDMYDQVVEENRRLKLEMISLKARLGIQ
jgi:hypothetical protein